MYEKLRLLPIPETKLPRQTLGAPMPLLINTDTKTFLFYYGYGSDDMIVVEWISSQLTLFSPYNDQHPLARAFPPTNDGNFFVHDSPLLSNYGISGPYSHHLMLFHDSIFECVAKDFSAYKSSQTFLATMTQILEQN